MNDQQWAYKGKWRRGKAMVFALLFHLVLLAGIAIAGDGKMEDLTPEFVKAWVASEPTEEEKQVKATLQNKPRP